MRTTRLTTLKSTRRRRHARAFLVVAASVVALAAAGSASAAPASAQIPTNTCWKDVVNDWLAHQPNLVGLYPIPCYTQAIQHLNAYSDVQAYSSATEDIHRALLAAIHQERGNGPGDGGSSSGGGGTSGGSSGGGSSGGSSGGGSSSSSGGPINSLFNDLGPGNAQSVPLPLLVLGALAGLLLLAGAGTWVARRFQARKMTPATAPATAPRQAPPKPR
jgi:hypothetical protein